MAVPVGETIELTIPAVCLNYGLTDATPRDTFKLMDVDEYTHDPRVRKALRSLATYGTSQGVAQAVMWRVCNDLPLRRWSSKRGKVMNTHEIALAARFVEALDASSASDLVDPARLSDGRIFVQVRGEGRSHAKPGGSNDQLDGLRLLGLPLQVVESDGASRCLGPRALPEVVLLTEPRRRDPRRDRRQLVLARRRVAAAGQGRVPRQFVGQRARRPGSFQSDRSSGRRRFVTVKPARRTLGARHSRSKTGSRSPSQTWSCRAGTSSGAPPVPFEGVGVGPARSALLPIQAATASLVEQVELNGL